jgi:hypothetical protein
MVGTMRECSSGFSSDNQTIYLPDKVVILSAVSCYMIINISIDFIILIILHD